MQAARCARADAGLGGRERNFDVTVDFLNFCELNEHTARQARGFPLRCGRSAPRHKLLTPPAKCCKLLGSDELIID